MRVLMVTAELAPLAKAGGLADMVAGLSLELRRRGHDLRVFLPTTGQPGAADHLPPVGDTATASVMVHGSHPPWRVRFNSQTAGALAGLPVYRMDCPALHHDSVYGGPLEGERFAQLCHGVFHLCASLDWWPDVIHCHDWHTALLPALLSGPWRSHAKLRHTAALLTIHNIGYQGIFAASMGEALGVGALIAARPPSGTDPINLLALGIEHAEGLTTVSPTHAAEILRPEYGHGLDRLLGQRQGALTGILNGVDYDQWDPSSDSAIPAPFGLEDLSGKAICRQSLLTECGLRDGAGPLVGMVTRLAAQKGLNIVLEAMPTLLESAGLRLVVLGAGDNSLEQGLTELQHRFPGRMAFVPHHDEAMARRIFAGSDSFLVPSLYEPCGLTQMYALRYGSVPVVRQTGGLADTIRHFDPETGLGNGSVFRDADAGGLRWGIEQMLQWYRTPRHWQSLVRNGMGADYSWSHQAPHYAALYKSLVLAAASGSSRPAV
jgi:starch synthase